MRGKITRQKVSASDLIGRRQTVIDFDLQIPDGDSDVLHCASCVSENYSNFEDFKLSDLGMLLFFIRKLPILWYFRG